MILSKTKDQKPKDLPMPRLEASINQRKKTKDQSYQKDLPMPRLEASIAT
jgi:hypothetical protein